MGMLGVTILIPGPPGLVGIFQTGIYCGMSMYFAPTVVTGEGARTGVRAAALSRRQWSAGWGVSWRAGASGSAGPCCCR